MGDDTVNISDINSTLESLLEEIQKDKVYLDSKSWYFAGSSTYRIIHGQNLEQTGFFEIDGVKCKYDQVPADVIIMDMFYDPRYNAAYVDQYNQSYTSYAIAYTSDGSINTYSRINLIQHAEETFANEEALYDINNTSLRYKAIQAYAAAYVMDKLDIIYNAIGSNGKTVVTNFINKMRKSEAGSIIETHITKLNSKLGISAQKAFYRYKASMDEMNLWYISDSDKEAVAEHLKTYKENIEKLYEIAYTAAENGGTLINCINSNRSDITGNIDSDINIAQIMVCINTEITATEDTEDDLNEYFKEIVEEISSDIKKSGIKKVAIIGGIVCGIIIVLSIGIMIALSIYEHSKQKKYKNYLRKGIYKSKLRHQY